MFVSSQKKYTVIVGSTNSTLYVDSVEELTKILKTDYSVSQDPRNPNVWYVTRMSQKRDTTS